MITITKIMGESYDVNTGQEVGRALVITNGISTATIEVPDEAIEVVVSLIAELHQRHQQPPQRAVPEEIWKEGSAPVRTAVPAKANGSRQRQPSPMREELPSKARDLFESALSGTVEPDEFEPGEVYDDPDTGVSSL